MEERCWLFWLAYGQTPVPLDQLGTFEEPEGGGSGEVRTEGKFGGPFAATYADRDEADEGTKKRGADDRKEDSFPPEEGTDGGKEFHIAEAHRFAGEGDFGHFPGDDVR